MYNFLSEIIISKGTIEDTCVPCNDFMLTERMIQDYGESILARVARKCPPNEYYITWT